MGSMRFFAILKCRRNASRRLTKCTSLKKEALVKSPSDCILPCHEHGLQPESNEDQIPIPALSCDHLIFPDLPHSKHPHHDNTIEIRRPWPHQIFPDFVDFHKNNPDRMTFKIDMAAGLIKIDHWSCPQMEEKVWKLPSGYPDWNG